MEMLLVLTDSSTLSLNQTQTAEKLQCDSGPPANKDVTRVLKSGVKNNKKVLITLIYLQSYFQSDEGVWKGKKSINSRVKMETNLHGGGDKGEWNKLMSELEVGL